MHLTSYDNMRYFVNKYLGDLENKKLKIIDIGSQDVTDPKIKSLTYRSLFTNENWKYQGLDIEAGRNVDIVVKNHYSWNEIKSQSYDVVISGQAFEHTEYFWITMLEISRILKQGGLCCILAPSSGHEHRYPVDCWRFFPDGFRALANFSGLEILESFHCWDREDIPIEENEWKDTVGIFRKNKQSFFQSFKFGVKNYIQKKLITL